jgi:putative phosphoesterase
MPQRIGVISDTHGLLREQALQELKGCSQIIHAGDIGDRQILDILQTVAPVIAVRGNIDTGSWARSLPRTQIVHIEEATLYVLHDLAGLDLDPAAAGFQGVITGHSHHPRREIRNGILYLNPGSAGPRRFHLPVTIARLEVNGRALHAELIHLAV